MKGVAKDVATRSYNEDIVLVNLELLENPSWDVFSLAIWIVNRNE